ncbi:GGDEF domain-containing protein [Roseospira goensis]|uniref:diguanylate cyclase n=1 Tax=Roseospira goensis TaxID=391922 RepID=A0A7W6RYI8_9PROT|nr:GGDEF domain-containing protein [Roseospira goensis]MBB4285070.1 diguanylate cyclase (GGDEF)-like protein [Roseospira goensis]
MLDGFTLFLVATVVSGVATGVVGFIWRLQPSVPGVRDWAFGLGALTVAMLATWLRHLGMPLAPSVVLTNLAVLLGYALIYRGSRLFMARRVPRHQSPFILFCVVVLILLYYFSAVDRVDLIRFVIMALVIAAFDGLIVATFWPRKRAGHLASGYILVVGVGLHGLVFLGRGLWGMVVLAGGPVGGTDLVVGLGDLTSVVAFMTLAMGFLALTAEHLLRQLEALAAQDPLTGVFNRRAFFAVAEHVIVHRSRTGQAVSVLVFDLDNFKAVNDTHGHAAGDDALRHVVTTARGALRGEDLLARLGGEEFVVLLPETNAGAALRVAERLRAAIATAPAVLTDGTRLTLTASVGVSTAGPQDRGETVASLIARADRALYAAKAAGRDRVRAEGAAPPRDVTP